MPDYKSPQTLQETEERQRRYVTTAIPYVNARPHIGFAMEVVQADVLARFYRQRGFDVRFQTGSDENSLKNVQAAEAAGVAVDTLVRRNADAFHDLRNSLDLSFDDFIRTSSDQRHRIGVEKLWAACASKGDIYKRAYEGLYCIGCEQFYKPDALRNGCCPEHGTPVDQVCEENYFFRLTRYEAELCNAIVSGDIEIIPAGRRNEVLAWIDQGLEDFSISRSASRARGWGIPVPGDPQQVIYVWFDALGNYITALGYGDDRTDFSKFWSAALTREHVIGKGITRFHAVYWPAMLLSAGLALPTRILVHGYVTVEGEKIGKSAGNAIDPLPIARDRGSDALRYYLLRHIRSTGDGDFSHERFVRAYDSELAGQLGNLAHRTLSMIDRYCDGRIPAPKGDHLDTDRLLRASGVLPATVESHLERFAFDEALAAIFEFIATANKYVADNEPWSLAKQASGRITGTPDTSASAHSALRNCLSSLAVSLYVIAECLAPLLPSTSDKLLRQLGADIEDIPQNKSVDKGTFLDGNAVSTSNVLFPRME